MILNDAATPAKAARALVRALEAFYGNVEPDAAEFASRAAPPPLDGDDHTINGREFLACRRRVTIARDGVPGLQFADPQAAPVRAPFRAGEEFEAAFLVEGAPNEGDTLWWVASDGTRIPASGTIQKFRRDW